MNTLLVCIICAFLSFVPMIELKGAIPIAMSHIWQESALSPWLACLVCSIGGVLSCFFIAFIFIFLKKRLLKIRFFRKVFTKLDDFLLKCISQESPLSTKKKMMIVFEFCALPLPLTGVWASGALCAVLNLSYLKSVWILILANLFSALFVVIICFLFSDFVDLIVCVMLIIFILQLVYKVISLCLQKKSKMIVKK